jgi:hypothetical protein
MQSKVHNVLPLHPKDREGLKEVAAWQLQNSMMKKVAKGGRFLAGV